MEKRKRLLFDAGSLRHLLGVGGTRKGETGKRKPSAELRSDDLFKTILLEETGSVSVTRLKRKKSRPKSNHRISVISGYEGVKASRLAINTIFAFAAEFGIPRDDIAFLDRQFFQISKIVETLEESISATYKTWSPADQSVISTEDANSVLFVCGVEIEDKFYEIICRNARLSPSNGDSKVAEVGMVDGQRDEHMDIDGIQHCESDNLDYSKWLRGVVSQCRLQLLAALFAERRGQVSPAFLDNFAIELEKRRNATIASDSTALLNSSLLEPRIGISRSKSDVYVSETANDALDGNDMSWLDIPTQTRYSKSQPSEGSNHSRPMGSHTLMPGEGRPASPGSQNVSMFSQFSKTITGGNASTVVSLPPVKLRILKQRTKRKKVMELGGFDETFCRGTPRCLQSMDLSVDRKRKMNSSFHTEPPKVLPNIREVMSTVEALRKELAIAQDGLSQLDNLLDENIAWVQTNCDSGSLGMGGLSMRSKKRCRNIASERMFVSFVGYSQTTLTWALNRWRRAVRFMAFGSYAKSFVRAMALLRLTEPIYDAIFRQLMRAWRPWVSHVVTQRALETAAATCEIQRIVRGRLGRCRVARYRRDRATVVIQCLFRRFRAGKLLQKRRLQATMDRVMWAVGKVHLLFQLASLRREARERLRSLRRNRSALRIQKVFRGFVGRKVALEKRDLLRVEREFAARMEQQRIAKEAEAARRKIIEEQAELTRLAEEQQKKSEIELMKQRVKEQRKANRGKGDQDEEEAEENPQRQKLISRLISSPSTLASKISSKVIPPPMMVPHGEGQGRNGMSSKGFNLEAEAAVKIQSVMRSKSIRNKLQKEAMDDAFSPFRRLFGFGGQKTDPTPPPSAGSGGGILDRLSKSLMPSPRVPTSGPPSRPLTTTSTFGRLFSHQEPVHRPVSTEEKARRGSENSPVVTGRGKAESVNSQEDRNVLSPPISSRPQTKETSTQMSFRQPEASSAIDREVVSSRPLVSEPSPPVTPQVMSAEPRSELVERSERPVSTQAPVRLPVTPQPPARPDSVQQDSRPSTEERSFEAEAATPGDERLEKVEEEFESCEKVDLPEHISDEFPDNVEEKIIERKLEGEGGLLESKVASPDPATSRFETPRPVSVANPNTARASTPNRITQIGSMMTNMLPAKIRRTISGKAMPKEDLAPSSATEKEKKARVGPLPTPEQAIAVMQCAARIMISRRRVQKRRREVQEAQRKTGQLILWAVVSIQALARGRKGRRRAAATRVAVQKARARRQLESAYLLQRVARGMIARKRVKKMRKAREDEKKMEMWTKYRSGKGKAKASGKNATDKKKKSNKKKSKTGSDDDSDEDADDEGEESSEKRSKYSREQSQELAEQIRRLEEIERNIAAKEMKMMAAAKLAEEKSAEMAKTLQEMEERARKEAAEFAARQQLLMMAAGPISARSEYRSSGPRRSVPQSARSAPSTARPLTGNEQRMMFHGQEWTQLLDEEHNAPFWFCAATGISQWHKPGTDDDQSYDSGYESGGAMTDYSTDNYQSGGEDYAESEYGDAAGNRDWQEYWDEQAQAKYWYNNATGEATWTKPAELVSGSGSNASTGNISMPPSARGASNDDWVSYLDEATGQEYWYNSKTGETSWAAY